MRICTVFVLVAGLLPAVIRCQPTPAKKSFEVASVKREDIDGVHNFAVKYEETPGSIRYRCSLLNLVQRAYELKFYQMENTTLLGQDLYEIEAKLPKSAQKDDIPAMLRSLLDDRFRFSAHWSENPTQVYRLTVDPAGLKLRRHRERPGKSATDLPKIVAPGQSGVATFRGPATLDRLTAFLDSGLGRPVVDETAVAGVFDISLDARFPPHEVNLSGLRSLPIFQGQVLPDPDNPPDLRFPGGTVQATAPEIGYALKQLGLRLDKAQGNVRVLVIDSVDKVPAAN